MSDTAKTMILTFILFKPRRPIPLGGEEVAILANLAVNVLTFFSNDQIFFCVFSYNIENFLFLVVFIYNKR